jgi:molecular chaperone DnaK (HSP70)
VTTAQDFQESVEIRVYQGESQQTEENELLGQFSFSEYEKGRRGDVEIDVTFEINTDGIVNVVARDRRTGKQASTRITLNAGLSETELTNIIEKGRTERVQTTAETQGDVLGTIPLRSVPAVATPDGKGIELKPEEDVLEVADVIQAPQADDDDEFVIVQGRPELSEPEVPEPEVPELEVDPNAKDELFGTNDGNLSGDEPDGSDTKG